MAQVQTPTESLINDDPLQHETMALTNNLENKPSTQNDLLWAVDRTANDWKSIDFSDANYLLDQFQQFRDIQMVSSEYRADALDGMAVISAFLVAFACNDLMQLESNSFDNSILFIIYTVFQMTIVSIGFL